MKVGNGEITRVTDKGELLVETTTGARFVRHNTHVVPGITKHIISITQSLREG